MKTVRALVHVAVVVSAVLGHVHEVTGRYEGLEFLEPCPRYAPDFEACLERSANMLAERFRHGLPKLGYNSPSEVEPIILDELHINLDGGPSSYKAEFKDITARGVSKVRVTGLRSQVTDDEVQLQLSLSIPEISADAKYNSSGKLIFVQAGGAGKYWGKYYHVRAKVFIRAKPYFSGNQKFLRLQQLKMDFQVPNIEMGVTNLPGGTKSFIQHALNVFINSHSQELLKEMKPDLKRKLIQVMSTFVERIFSRIPYNAFITD
ncbi:protein takeout [Copidosoma floridanum]|uniref:protein takeout n=1 Tax=Copidosoma floridanum TaxID=29053 RepID=UPI0006C9CA60|nr:protein takeout [Copidosoma floridanum]